jgi:hypothetical protein
MSGSRARYRNFLTWAGAAALAFGLAGRAHASIDFKLPVLGDAELREDDPTNARGTTGPMELAVRFTGGTNRQSMMRFDLTGITAGSFSTADFRLTVQRSGTFPTAAGGLRVYGLLPTAPNQNWNDATVYYRNRGTHTNQPNATTPFSGAPTAEDPVYGASASDPNNAPGLTFQAPPFSATAWNGGVTPANQPNYNATSGGDAGTVYPVVTEDFDATKTTLLGYLNYDAVSPARAGGTVLTFTAASNIPTQSSGAANDASNGTNLVNWLNSVINAGGTSATIMVASKLTGDPGNVNSSNHIFGSREEGPTQSGTGVPTSVGQYAPVLVLDPTPRPEPASAATLLAATAAGALVRRRRSQSN